MRPHVRRPSPSRPPRAGFSLVELMVTLVLLAVVVAVIATVLIGSQRSKAVTEGRLEAQQGARVIADIMANDIRSAGYQIDENASPRQTAFAYVDSVEIVINANLSPFPDTLLILQQPQALDPLGVPIPPVLDGTAYEPAMKYATGAETIRYTLDLNNDGAVDATDQAHPLASEAQRTANPNDYVLARVVYGAGMGGLPLNNGGSPEKVGLVRGPASDVPKMFTVYLGSNPNPWDWADGAIPQDRLDEISRVSLQVTTESRRKGPDGNYTRATLTSEINSIRNVPNAANTTYSVEGWVFDDLNRNQTRDTGEPGIQDAMIRLGTASVATTNASGYYQVHGAPAVYVLKQVAPEGFAAFAPDSVTIDFIATPGDWMHSFADTARMGGWLVDTCFVDTDGNSVYNYGDELVDGVTMTVGGQTRTSDAFGHMDVFLPPGTHSVSFTAPESMVVASTNPLTIGMSHGTTVRNYTMMTRGGTGTVSGSVYNDVNKNGTKETGETGIANVWVGVTKGGGTTTLSFALTDASGNYTINAPNNMPAATTPYEITCIPASGRFPTSPVSISPIWLSVGQTIPNQNFGMALYTQLTLNADRVLSLTSGELLEKDWTGADNQWATKASFDKDLILGSEYVSNPNVSVWHNRFDSNPALSNLFTLTPDYSKNAQSSALSVVAGPLDGNVPTQREDVVTGLSRKASGSIAIWLNKNTSGNLGVLVDAPVLYQPQNGGDANVVLLRDFGGTTALDLMVGTTGSANQGTLETWINSGIGTFTRDEIYPPEGNLPSNALGEVKAVVFANCVGDTTADLVVGTKIAPGYGRVHVLGFNSRGPANRYRHVRSFDVTGEVTSMIAAYVDYDTNVDIIVGTRVSSTAGNIQYWRGDGSGDFSLAATYTAQGPVLSLARGDFGGSARDDVVFGYRLNESVYAGGVRILYLDSGTLPGFEVDPAGGTHDYMAPSMTVNNFNYRLNPTTSGTIYPDLAVATKTGATTGALLVFVR